MKNVLIKKILAEKNTKTPQEFINNIPHCWISEYQLLKRYKYRIWYSLSPHSFGYYQIMNVSANILLQCDSSRV